MLKTTIVTGLATVLALSIAACGGGSGTHWTQSHKPTVNQVAQSVVGMTAGDGTTVESSDTTPWPTPGADTYPDGKAFSKVTVYPSGDAQTFSCLTFSDGTKMWSTVTLYANGNVGFAQDQNMAGQTVSGCQ